jgi:hypothetical protein
VCGGGPETQGIQPPVSRAYGRPRVCRAAKAQLPRHLRRQVSAAEIGTVDLGELQAKRLCQRLPTDVTRPSLGIAQLAALVHAQPQPSHNKLP